MSDNQARLEERLADARKFAERPRMLTASSQQEEAVGHVRWLLAELARVSAERDELREALADAAITARHLHAMIPRQVWRDTGGDDGQGHYEGDYRASKIAEDIERAAALARGGDA